MIDSIISSIISTKWVDIITSVGTIITVIFAYIALSTWKNQKKAEIQTKFLDELTDEIHGLINELNSPLEFMNFIKISIESHKLTKIVEDDYSAAISYIERNGQSDSKQFKKYIDPCATHVIKIRSMVSKGQTLSFRDYKKCMNACNMITLQYDRLQSIYVMLAMKNVNWTNNLVERALKSVLTIDYKEMKDQLAVSNVTFLEFVKSNYENIFKKT